MKILKPIIALLLIVALGAVSVACLDDGADSSVKTAEPSDGVSTDDGSDDVDDDAIAITLGNMNFTVADLQEAYDYYVDYYEYYGEEWTASIDFPFEDYDSVYEALLAMSIEDVISSNTVLWQAELAGVTLTEEELAEVEVEVQALEDEMLSYFIEDAESSSDGTLTEAELEEQAMANIDSYLASYGYTYDDYMSDYRDYMTEEAIISKMSVLFAEDYEVAQEEVDAWIETLKNEQIDSFEADPLAYRTQADSYAAGTSDEPLLYAPEGFIRVQLISIAPEGELDASYDTNLATMAELEAEYGALVLNGEDEERQAQIISDYATLKANVESTYTLYIKSAQDAAAEAYSRVEAGEDFAALMSEYNSETPTDDALANGVLVYTLSEDSNYSSELWSAITALPQGSVSNVLQIDGVFYIVKVLGSEPSGELEISEEEYAALADAAAEELAAGAWDDQVAAWFELAKQEMITFPEAYAHFLN
ncbi:MAG: peptidylprolyl isomerase [Clostridia bacterium]|nr:peptidylprolyl isomerase [Clostridia bacterium]